MKEFINRLKKRKRTLIGIIIVLLVVLGAVLFSLYWSNQQIQDNNLNLISSPNTAVSSSVSSPISSYAVSYTFIEEPENIEANSFHVLSGKLFSVDSNGKAAHLNITSEYIFNVSKISPDGKNILFSTGDPALSYRNTANKLYQYNVENKQLKLLVKTQTPVLSYPYEPNGTSFLLNTIEAFTYCNDSIVYNIDRSLYKFSAGKSELIDQQDVGNFSYIECSTDGKYLISNYYYHDSGDSAVYSYSAGKYTEAKIPDCCSNLGEYVIPKLVNNKLFIAEYRPANSNDNADRTFTLSEMRSDGTFVKRFEQKHKGTEFVTYDLIDGNINKLNQSSLTHTIYNLEGKTLFEKQFNYKQGTYFASLRNEFVFIISSNGVDLKVYEVGENIGSEINITKFLNSQSSELYKKWFRESSVIRTANEDTYIYTINLQDRIEHWIFNKKSMNWSKLFTYKQ